MIGLNTSLFQLLLFSFASMMLFLICLMVGMLLFNIRLKNNIRTYYINAFLGLFLLIGVFSICIVGIKTINILQILILSYLFVKKGFKVNFIMPNLKDLIPLLYIFPSVFLIYGCYTIPESIENDVRFYSKISYSLIEFRNENIFHFYNQYNEKFHGVMPYHYSELWLSSIFTSLFGLKSIISLKYLVYPFFISSISYGIIGFIDRNRFYNFILFIGLSLLPLYFVSVFKTGYFVYTDFWLRPNFIMYYYCFIALFYFILEENWDLTFITAIIISSTSFIILPCLFGGILCLSAILFYKKEINKKQFYTSLFLLFITSLVIILIYKLYSPHVNLYGTTSLKAMLLESLKLWKSIVYIIATLFIECGFLVLLSYLINRYLIKNKINATIYFFLISQVFIGVTIFQTVNKLDNAYQFPYFAFAGSGLILIITIIFYLDKIQSRSLKYLALILFFALSYLTSSSKFTVSTLLTSLETKNILNNNVSVLWTEEVKKYFESNKNAMGGFVLSKKDLKDYAPKGRNCLTYQVGSFISYFTNNCNLPSLTCIDTLFYDKTIENQNEFKKSITWYSNFPNYTKECNFNNYIKNGTVDYIICTKNALTIDSDYRVISDENSKYCLVTKK